MVKVAIREESAREILAIFKEKEVLVGGPLSVGQVNLEFAMKGGQAADCHSGCQYAVENGWLEQPSHIMLRLTKSGFAEMNNKRAFAPREHHQA